MIEVADPDIPNYRDKISNGISGSDPYLLTYSTYYSRFLFPPGTTTLKADAPFPTTRLLSGASETS